jgi:hypothetical protein
MLLHGGTETAEKRALAQKKRFRKQRRNTEEGGGRMAELQKCAGKQLLTMATRGSIAVRHEV